MLECDICKINAMLKNFKYWHSTVKLNLQTIYLVRLCFRVWFFKTTNMVTPQFTSKCRFPQVKVTGKTTRCVIHQHNRRVLQWQIQICCIADRLLKKKEFGCHSGLEKIKRKCIKSLRSKETSGQLIIWAS